MTDIPQPSPFTQPNNVPLANTPGEPLSMPDFSDPSVGNLMSDFGMGATDDFSWDMIGLGLEEPLPSQDIIDDMYVFEAIWEDCELTESRTQIYFEKIHPSLPMIHRPRFLAAMDLAPHMRPPVALRYAMWTQVCSITPRYYSLQEHFYARARKYAELDEMKGHGENMITLAHAQAWSLIAAFEFKMMFFPRAWMSCGRATRLCQMMGLHRLDGVGLDVKQCLPPPRDWTEREERRRTFWMAFCQDRYASIGTGWPMTIDEQDVRETPPLYLSACDFMSTDRSSLDPDQSSRKRGCFQQEQTRAHLVFGRCYDSRWRFHAFAVRRSRVDGLPFWTEPHPSTPSKRTGPRSRYERGILEATSCTWQYSAQHVSFTASPATTTGWDIRCQYCFLQHEYPHFDHLPSPGRYIQGWQKPHATTNKCWEQAEMHHRCRSNHEYHEDDQSHWSLDCKFPNDFLKEGTLLMTSQMNPFIAFCLYVAARVFVQYLKSRKDDATVKSSLHFLLSAMQALKSKNPLTESFLVQLDVDLEGSGLSIPSNISRYQPGEKRGPVSFP
jgi:hypothetical protein